MRRVIRTLAQERTLALTQAKQLRDAPGTEAEKADNQKRAAERESYAKECANACSELWKIVREKESAGRPGALEE